MARTWRIEMKSALLSMAWVNRLFDHSYRSSRVGMRSRCHAFRRRQIRWPFRRATVPGTPARPRSPTISALERHKELRDYPRTSEGYRGIEHEAINPALPRSCPSRLVPDVVWQSCESAQSHRRRRPVWSSDRAGTIRAVSFPRRVIPMRFRLPLARLVPKASAWPQKVRLFSWAPP